MSATSGPTSRTPFAFFDPGESCWRTSQGTFPWDSGTFSGTWPKRGSMRSGACYEHPTWEPPTSERGCSSSPTMPTPTGDDANNVTRASGEYQSLARTAHNLLPTPERSDGTGGRISKEKGGTRPSGAKRAVTLATAVHHDLALLPTPVVNDMGEGKTVEWWDDWTEEQKAKHGNGNGHGPSLAIEAQRLLPTPQASSERKSRKAMVGNRQWSAPGLEQALELAQGTLPREFEDWTEVPGWSGARTGPPSIGGRPVLDVPLPDPSTIEDGSVPPSSSG